jgi:TPR repeat protein
MKMFGQGTGKDVESGLAIVKALAAAGDADSLLFLGDLYQGRGNVVRTDLAQSYGYFRKAAEAGSVLGKVRTGEMLARGQGVAQDVTAGRDLVYAIAELDNPVALVSFGDLLTDRNSGPIDLSGAQSAYERAAALGRADALVRLGDIFRAGTIVAVNPAVAFRYYQRAEAAGDLIGKLRVGEMTALGEGTPKNVEAGLALVRRVAQAGDDYAYVVLGDLCISINTEAAVDAYEEAAQRGRIDALLRLGDLYRSGRGVPVDGKKAAEYYLRAANAEAMSGDTRGANESN